MNNDEISKIADVLSTHLAIEQETKKQRQVATPGRAVPVRSNSNDSKLSRSKINEELGIKDNISSNENSETEENFEEETDLVGKVRASRENSTTSNADLEWDDDYTFNSRESPTEMSPRLMTFSDENEEAIINEEAYLNQEVNDAKEEEKPKVKNSARVNSKVHVDQKSVNSGINFYGTEETEEEAWSVGKRYTETNDIASEPSKEAEVGQRELILQPTEEKKDEKRRRQRKVKRKNTDVNKILSREDDTSHRKQKESFSQQTGSSKKTESPKGSPTAPTNTSNKAGSLSGQPQNSNKKQASSKTSRSSKKTRHKIYLDDPDVHQCIQDHATMLRKFIDDVESGKFVHSPKNRLHPVSRDDISPGMWSANFSIFIFLIRMNNFHSSVPTWFPKNVTSFIKHDTNDKTEYQKKLQLR